MFGRNHKRVSGFTLVELLVVIGIIALLISLLLPSLNKARAAANAVQCASQMRQIGMGLMLYSQKHKGQLIAGITGVASPLDNWSKVCAAELVNRANEGANSREKVFRCPSNLISAQGDSSSHNSYFAGAALLGDIPAGVRPMKLTRVRNPVEKIFVAESINGSNYTANPDGSGSRIAANWHYKGSNFLFGDFHVDRVVDKAFDMPLTTRVSGIEYSTSTKQMWFRWADRNGY